MRPPVRPDARDGPPAAASALSAETAGDAALRRTPLHALHGRLGAQFAPFAGYQMPIHYRGGIIAEHHQTRRRAGLFDVSHMGQIQVRGDGAAAALERLLPIDVAALGPNRQAYALLNLPDGGVLDDVMVTRWGEQTFVLVVNAARREQDFAHLRAHLPKRVALCWLADRALLALQGPEARQVIGAIAPAAARLPFLRGCRVDIDGVACCITCSGYTGEDGFEISVPAGDATALAESLLASPRVGLAGLGARDTLRLEAGMCLYGQELDIHTTLVEAGLSWSVAAARRADGAKAGRFLGAQRILPELFAPPRRRRCGLVAEGRAVMRAGAELFADGSRVGVVSSGSFSPTLGRPIAMAYTAPAWASPGQRLSVSLRGRAHPVRVARMPFVPHQRYRG